MFQGPQHVPALPHHNTKHEKKLNTMQVSHFQLKFLYRNGGNR